MLWTLMLSILAGCVPFNGVSGDDGPLVNLQVTEDQDLPALERFMAALNVRQIKATMIVNEHIATQGCDQLKGYDAAGHEIMVYGRPDEPAGQTVELTDLSYEQQKEIIALAKTAIEECLGHTVPGFRSYHFAHDADTWRILDELGIQYNLSFVAHSTNAPAGHADDVWLCPVEGYDFWAVPMHSVETPNGTKAFCDRPFSSLTAEDWEQLMKDELDRMHARGEPLKVEFHPWFSANDEDRWNAFVHFLDYAEERQAEFITVATMLERMPSAE